MLPAVEPTASCVVATPFSFVVAPVFVSFASEPGCDVMANEQSTPGKRSPVGSVTTVPIATVSPVPVTVVLAATVTLAVEAGGYCAWAVDENAASPRLATVTANARIDVVRNM
jgi:hypothetical protein